MKTKAIETARTLRKELTKSEIILRDKLRNRKFLGLKFRRQHPIEIEYDNQKRFYIADFYCHEKKIIIEIDGNIHNYQKEYDQERDDVMIISGYRILRLKKEEILNSFEKVKGDLTLTFSSELGE